MKRKDTTIRDRDHYPSSNLSTPPNVPQQPRALEKALDQLGKALDELETRTKCLREVMAITLRPDEAMGNTGEEKKDEAPPRSELIQIITKYRNSVQRIDENIHDLTTSTEL